MLIESMFNGEARGSFELDGTTVRFEAYADGDVQFKVADSGFAALEWLVNLEKGRAQPTQVKPTAEPPRRGRPPGRKAEPKPDAEVSTVTVTPAPVPASSPAFAALDGLIERARRVTVEDVKPPTKKRYKPSATAPVQVKEVGVAPEPDEDEEDEDSDEEDGDEDEEGDDVAAEVAPVVEPPLPRLVTDPPNSNFVRGNVIAGYEDRVDPSSEPVWVPKAALEAATTKDAAGRLFDAACGDSDMVTFLFGQEEDKDALANILCKYVQRVRFYIPALAGETFSKITPEKLASACRSQVVSHNLPNRFKQDSAA